MLAGILPSDGGRNEPSSPEREESAAFASLAAATPEIEHLCRLYFTHGSSGGVKVAVRRHPEGSTGDSPAEALGQVT